MPSQSQPGQWPALAQGQHWICCLVLALGIILGAQPGKTLARPANSSGAEKTGFRIIDFQTSRSVGRLYAGRLDSNGGWATETDLGPAQGKVRVPEAGQVMLDLNFNGAADLSFLDRLGAYDLTALLMSNHSAGFDISDKELARIGRLTGLELLNIESSEAGAITMDALGHLTKLRSLNLSDIMIKDRDTANLAKLSKLQFLTFNHNDLSDAAFIHVQNLTDLRILHAKRCGLTCAGVKYLTRLTKLQELALASDKIGDAGVRALPPMPELVALDLGDCGLTPACLPLLTKFPKLSALAINWCEPTRGAFDSLCKLKSLWRIIITGKPCDVANIAGLNKAPRLQILIVTVAPEARERAKKLLPHIKIEFGSALPIEVFAPVH